MKIRTNPWHYDNGSISRIIADIFCTANLLGNESGQISADCKGANFRGVPPTVSAKPGLNLSGAVAIGH